MNATKGLVVPAGGGKYLDMTTPGRFAALKLLGHETNGSIMLFEETIPAGTKSLFHLHRDSDEVAWVLAGEITFQIGDEVRVGGPGTCAFLPRNVPHAWKNTGQETSRVVFFYTPAAAGGYVEELLNRPGPMNDAQRKELRERYRWGSRRPKPALRGGAAPKRVIIIAIIAAAACPGDDTDVHANQTRPTQAGCGILRGQGAGHPEPLGVKTRTPCLKSFSKFLKPGVQNIDNNNLVAPTGFEPVFQSRPRFRHVSPILVGQSGVRNRRD